MTGTTAIAQATVTENPVAMAVFMVGLVAGLSLLTWGLRSPVSILGFGLTMLFSSLYAVGAVSFRVALLVYAIHGLTIAATGAISWSR